MKKTISLLLLITSFNSFSQILSPNGNNVFSYNGLADITFRYADRGTGGRAFVHADGNILSLNFDNDFKGGTRIGNDVFFKDNGNSYISSGNFGIGTYNPLYKLDVIGSLGIGSESVNANTTKIFLRNPVGKTWAISSGANMVTESSFSIYNWSDNQSTPFFHIASNGNVGIGNFQPDAPLTVYGKSHFYPARIGAGDARFLEISNSASFSAFIDNDFPVFLRTGGGNQPLILDAARVGIGTANPDSQLAVNGTIHSKEVKVDLTGWSDFVFKKEYNLPTLQEVEKHINEKGHLENIPSEDDALKNGINLGEMNAKLLQKIEELTLYSIQQNKKIEEQSKEIESLKELALRVTKIENELSKK
ncbi:hypothetical protein [Flavobacterium chilense]|uniref:Uncharacterized protein n=1 Tax=Flavobacterium chilense TaxID=946677 RepID=A0A1M7N0B6_9FLAO|nr:hypothetical protein [Flavobacterium chilense]SHM96935.1 hypothetical protein SAMN05444484_11710 [Flavobacterium chilense]